METKNSGMKINEFGQVIISDENIKRLIFEGKSINRITTEDTEDIELFKKHQKELLSELIEFEDQPNIPVDEFHNIHSEQWTFPKEYQEIDIKEWLLEKCKTKEEIDRVTQELILYEERNLLMVLRLFIFIVDYMRKNNFIWGVGRGSSVSSYVLFLIGIHRVNSIQYNLDINDYLK
jgi:DNA polymerase III alpha subunit